MGKAAVVATFLVLALILRLLVFWVVVLIEGSDLSPFSIFKWSPLSITLIVSLATYLLAIYALKARSHYLITGGVAAAISVLILLPNAMKLGPKIAVYACTNTAIEWLVIGTLAHLGTRLLLKTKTIRE